MYLRAKTFNNLHSFFLAKTAVCFLYTERTTIRINSPERQKRRGAKNELVQINLIMVAEMHME